MLEYISLMNYSVVESDWLTLKWKNDIIHSVVHLSSFQMDFLFFDYYYWDKVTM